MKSIIINKILINITNSNTYSNTKLEEIKYGLESLYIITSKTILMMIICIILGVFKEFLYFLIAFGLLKITCFGIHLKKGWQCTLTSIPIFVGIPYLIKYCALPNSIVYLIAPILLLVICLYSPSDTEKRPLINKRKRKRYKTISIINSLIYILIIIIVNNAYLTSILFYSLLLISIIINPITYKIFGLKYKNYLSYKKKGE